MGVATQGRGQEIPSRAVGRVTTGVHENLWSFIPHLLQVHPVEVQ